MIQRTIQKQLNQIEADEDVTILYACESGSRAWGFESTDSDYDVRFIYLRKTPWYMYVHTKQKRDKRDVIEVPVDDTLDICGWDLPKALGLLGNSNPPLLEWLQSPIVYRKDGWFMEQISCIINEYYSPVACIYHYLHMGEGNFRKYIMNRDEVRLKKYFYVLRPILGCLWIERGYGVVPMEFDKLIERVDDPDVLKTIQDLLVRKKAGEELDSGPMIPILTEFLRFEIDRLNRIRKSFTEMVESLKTPDTLDQLFVNVLCEINGSVL